MVDSVWVISFIEVLIRRAQKILEIRAKYVARKSTYGYTLCFVVAFQFKLAYWYRFFILQNSRMITGINRKRWNRGLKRRIEKGIISEEKGNSKFIRALSQCPVFEAKSQRSKMEAFKDSLFSLVGAAKISPTSIFPSLPCLGKRTFPPTGSPQEICNSSGTTASIR